jgi:putative lipase involved disintegration of autophagic bodies
VGASDDSAVRLGSVLSVVVGLWGLGALALPLGLLGGAVAALFGLTFGLLAIRTKAWGGWRKAAKVGIGISGLALLVAAVEVVYFVSAG